MDKGGAAEMATRQFLEVLLQDLRYAGRMLRSSPGFTVTAIAALALGIGDNTAIFSVVNTVLLQPLAYPEPDRLVQLELSSAQGNGNITSIPKFMVWQAQRQVFQDVAAYDFGGPGINRTVREDHLRSCFPAGCGDDDSAPTQVWWAEASI